MKRSLKKFVSCLLLLSLSVSLVFAGGKKEGAVGSESETKKAEHLVMYLLGDPARDQDLVVEKLNELTLRDLNATVEINFIPWADLESKYQLLLSSGEDFDLIYASNWVDYSEYAKNGAFLPLENLLPEYATQTWSEIPKSGWDQTVVNDHIFLVPKNYNEFGGFGLLYRKDLARKGGLDKVDNVNSMMRYFEIVKKELPGTIPLNLGTEQDLGSLLMLTILMENAEYGWIHNLALDGIWVPIEGEGVPFLRYDTEMYRSYLDFVRKGTESGYWSRNALSNNVRSRDAFLNGVSASSLVNPVNAAEDYERLMAKNPGWELDYWDFEYAAYGFKPRLSLISDGMAVNRNAANPELALKLLEKLHNDEEYYNLTWYGIRGKHWDLDADGYLVFPDGVSADSTGYPWGETCPWGWTEQKFNKKSSGGWKQMEVMMSTWGENAKINPYENFSFNKEPVNAEMAALKQIEDEYARPLEAGIVDDVEKGVQELLKQQKLGGIEKVLQEVTRQWNLYLESNK